MSIKVNDTDGRVTLEIDDDDTSVHSLGHQIVDLWADYYYCVVLPEFYDATPTRHRTAAAAIRTYKALDGYEGVTILDRDGVSLDFVPGGPGSGEALVDLGPLRSPARQARQGNPILAGRGLT